MSISDDLLRHQADTMKLGEIQTLKLVNRTHMVNVAGGEPLYELYGLLHLMGTGSLTSGIRSMAVAAGEAGSGFMKKHVEDQHDRLGNKLIQSMKHRYVKFGMRAGKAEKLNEASVLDMLDPKGTGGGPGNVVLYGHAPYPPVPRAVLQEESTVVRGVASSAASQGMAAVTVDLQGPLSSTDVHLISAFDGGRVGYDFKTGSAGLGYYPAEGDVGDELATAAEETGGAEEEGERADEKVEVGEPSWDRAALTGARFQTYTLIYYLR